MKTYYAPPVAVQEGRLVLPEEESYHAVRVLRAHAGDEIAVVDGEGGWYHVRLDQLDKRRAAGVVLEQRRDVGEPAYELTVGLALLKQRGRFETFLEKAVELGVHTVIPLITARTEKQQIRASRSQNILIAAMKQCGRSRLIHLTVPQSLKAVLAARGSAFGLFCHEQVVQEDALAEALVAHPSVQPLVVLVGPEGGFTPTEVEQAQQAGYLPVSLGPRCLRAETAAIVAATAVMMAQKS